ncbi:hypothetical protein QBC46DRAFT_266256 [Diplogelasinospora grovesii]|uniref:Uncharacterized protein n=1 Tax=Diplogelasinospora grovesii TaxID=303347 RepID=A0AAN6N5A7_9PEZI|nr:hypothetical protein QBC46DRAFT_266256 [Diplogelasinospora grovesii]
MFVPNVSAITALCLFGTAVLAATKPISQTCGFKMAPCPTGQTCSILDLTYTRGENCASVCITTLKPTLTTVTTKPAPTYRSCGGFRIEPKPCPEGQICIDDPFSGGCGMACDAPGICVTPTFCGGFAGIQCKDGKKCVDDPRDDCDLSNGGADCGGICI